MYYIIFIGFIAGGSFEFANLPLVLSFYTFILPVLLHDINEKKKGYPLPPLPPYFSGAVAIYITKACLSFVTNTSLLLSRKGGKTVIHTGSKSFISTSPPFLALKLFII